MNYIAYYYILHVFRFLYWYILNKILDFGYCFTESQRLQIFLFSKTNSVIILINCFTEKKNRVNKDETALHSPISPVETNKVPNQV